MQPPPRGCVLKHQRFHNKPTYHHAAASARLCVETSEEKPYLLFNRSSRLRGSRLRAAVC